MNFSRLDVCYCVWLKLDILPQCFPAQTIICAHLCPLFAYFINCILYLTKQAPLTFIYNIHKIIPSLSCSFLLAQVSFLASRNKNDLSINWQWNKQRALSTINHCSHNFEVFKTLQVLHDKFFLAILHHDYNFWNRTFLEYWGFIGW